MDVFRFSWGLVRSRRLIAAKARRNVYDERLPTRLKQLGITTPKRKSNGVYNSPDNPSCPDGASLILFPLFGEPESDWRFVDRTGSKPSILQEDQRLNIFGGAGDAAKPYPRIFKTLLSGMTVSKKVHPISTSSCGGMKRRQNVVTGRPPALVTALDFGKSARAFSWLVYSVCRRGQMSSALALTFGMELGSRL